MLDLNAIKIALESKLHELQIRADEIEESLCAAKNPDSEERALELENDQTIEAIAKVTESEILDIKLALRRIDSGDYSTCIDCGKHILKERLSALPWTSRCAACS